MERIIPGDTVEFTMALAQENERREEGKVVTANPQVVWVTLPNNDVIKRHRVKHNVQLIKGPQKAPQTPKAPEPETGKEVKRSLDDLFNSMKKTS